MHVCRVHCWLLTLPCMAVGTVCSMFRVCRCWDPACGCLCVVWRLQRAAASSWQQPTEIWGKVPKKPRKPRKRVWARSPARHTSAHNVLWSQGASALVRVSGSKRSVKLKSITKATAPYNPILSYPIHELCAVRLARFPWGPRGDGSGAVCFLSVSALTLSAWAGSESHIKGTFGAFWQEAVWIMQTHPYCVRVSLCVQWCQFKSFMGNHVERTSYFMQTTIPQSLICVNVYLPVPLIDLWII